MEKNKNLKEIVIKVEGKKWEAALDKAFKKANAKAKIDGFRPGKAPKDVFLKHYGIESLFMDASNYAVEDAYNQMIEENKDLIMLLSDALMEKETLTKEEIDYLVVHKNLPQDDVEMTLEELKALAKEQNIKSEDLAIAMAAYMLGFGSYKGFIQ